MAEHRPPASTPFPEVRQEINRLFRELIHQSWGGRGATAPEAWQPCCDMMETDDAIIVEIELPGVHRDDVQIDIEGDMLRITGERRAVRRYAGRNYYYVERQQGHFTRQLRLPRIVDRSRIKAEFAEGVLTLTLPKHTEQPPATGRQEEGTRHG